MSKNASDKSKVNPLNKLNEVSNVPLNGPYMKDYTSRMRPGPPSSILEASKQAFTKVSDSVFNLVTYKTAQIAVTIIDSVNLMITGMQELDPNKRNEIVAKLAKKARILNLLANDPDIKTIVSDSAKSFAVIAGSFFVELQPPLRQGILETLYSTQETLMESLDKMQEFTTNIFKLVPVLGDSYIIVENVLAASNATSNVIARSSETIDTWSKIFYDLNKNLISKMSTQLSSLEKNQTKINDLIEVLDQTSNVSRAIEKGGDDISNFINQGRTEREKQITNKIIKTVTNPNGGSKKKQKKTKKRRGILKKNKNKKQKNKTVRFKS